MVHDREQACNGVFRDDTTESEAYKADVRDPVDLKRMAMLNKPLLVGRALPPAVHGDIHCQHSGHPETVRVPGQGELGDG